MVPLEDDDPRQVGGYRLLYRLGAGGMGRVYLGRSAGGRYTALKVVHPGLASAPGFRERFAREIRASRAVSGKGTVKVVAADAHASTPWLASTYVPGPALAEIVHESGPLPEAALWRLLSGLAQALNSVHESGLVHRDLKPSNVLLSQDGPLLIDFGIARAADETALTGTGLVMGSAGYISPEQAEGREVTQAADVFALGALLAYAATGRGPFGTGSGPELLYRVVHHEPDLSGMPAALADVARDCLAKRPEDRPSLADLRARAAAHDSGSRDWLPGAVSAEIARRAEHLLNLEHTDFPDPPSDASSEAPTAPVVLPPTRVDSRPGAGPSRQAGREPAAAPAAGAPAAAVTSSPRAAVAAPRAGNPGAWMRDVGFWRPGLGMWGLVPMLALLLMVPKLHALDRDYPESAENIDFGGLSGWAQHTHWFMPLPVLLLVVMLLLQYTWARLHRYPRHGVRIWAAASAIFWLSWAATVAVSTAWYLGMDDGFSGDAATPHTSDAYIGLHLCVGLALFGNALAAPFVGIGAVVRLNRVLTEEVTVPPR